MSGWPSGVRCTAVWWAKMALSMSTRSPECSKVAQEGAAKMAQIIRLLRLAIGSEIYHFFMSRYPLVNINKVPGELEAMQERMTENIQMTKLHSMTIGCEDPQPSHKRRWLYLHGQGFPCNQSGVQRSFQNCQKSQASQDGHRE